MNTLKNAWFLDLTFDLIYGFCQLVGYTLTTYLSILFIGIFRRTQEQFAHTRATSVRVGTNRLWKTFNHRGREFESTFI